MQTLLTTPSMGGGPDSFPIAASTMPQLDCCRREALVDYFENAWALEETLMASVIDQETFYCKPDPLRNDLIFYLGHTVAFYINKLVLANLLPQGINSAYEALFAVGVDPATPDELTDLLQAVSWPSVADVWCYRQQVKEAIVHLLHTHSLDLPIHPHHPLWALLMGIEHSRVHFETSSVLLRQLPADRLRQPATWHYAPSFGPAPENRLQNIPGGMVHLGKPGNEPTYGWDCEYGDRDVWVEPFAASQFLVSNQEFLAFVKAGGYGNPQYWTASAWAWRQQCNIQHPRFWVPEADHYRYRAMFDEIDLPLDWPVEVNYYEALAFCCWKGQGYRLLTEAEWQRARAWTREVAIVPGSDPVTNLNLRFISPSPVGWLAAYPNQGLCDLQGNVWEWLADPFTPLPGFQPHSLYLDHAAPFFDDQHRMMLGGSWASNGSMAAPSYRNWFRPHFYQHVGFRLARSG